MSDTAYRAIIADNLTGPVDTIDEFGDIAGLRNTLQAFLRKFVNDLFVNGFVIQRPVYNKK